MIDGEAQSSDTRTSLRPPLIGAVQGPVRAGRLLNTQVGYLVLAALAIALGATLRVLGYFGDELQLWVDEAWWAIALVDGDYPWIRPIGYMELTRVLVNVVNNEQVLRSLSLVGGLLHTPLALAALRLSTSSRWIALFGAYVVAIHPVAVSMSKEFKPYGLELSVHLLLLCCALAYLRTDRLVYLVGLVASAVVAPFFAWSAVFAYPAAFAVAGLRAIRGRRVADVAVAAGGAALTLAVLAGIWFGRIGGEDSESEYWGNKYDVFYVGGSRIEGGTWLARKTVDLASFPGQLDLAFPSRPAEAAAVTVLGFASIALGTVGAVALVSRRRWALAALWIAPWLIALAFNLAGKWPWGIFRTNLFMLAYAIGLLCHGLAELSGRVSTLGHRARQGAALGLAFVVLLTFPVDPSPFATKPNSTMAISSSVRTAMERIYALDGASDRREPRTIAFDTYACSIFRYYADYHAETKGRFSTFFSPTRYPPSCAKATLPDQWSDFLHDGAVYSWVISAKPGLVPTTRDDARRACEAAGGRVDIYEELPAGTALMRCSTSRPSAASGAGRDTASVGSKRAPV